MSDIYIDDSEHTLAATEFLFLYQGQKFMIKLTDSYNSLYEYINNIDPITQEIFDKMFYLHRKYAVSFEKNIIIDKSKLIRFMLDNGVCRTLEETWDFKIDEIINMYHYVGIRDGYPIFAIIE